MNLCQQLANQFREVTLNGKWIALTNLKDKIDELSWEQATTSVHGLNTIALLTFHIHYYVAGLIQVLEGGTLDIRDKFRFDMPTLKSKDEWVALKAKVFADCDRFARLIEQLPEGQLEQAFVDEKYGTYYRNIMAMVEHAYYHLGQIVLLRKIIE